MTELVRSTPVRVLLALAAIVVIIAGMKAAVDIIVPLLLSGFIAIMAVPPMFWLERHKVPSALAILIVILAVFLFALLVIALIGTSLNDFTGQMPAYQQKLGTEMSALIGWFNQHGIRLSSQQILEYVNPAKAMQLASRILKGLGAALSNTFLILLTVIFILAEASSFPYKLRAIFGDRRSLAGFDVFLANVKTYVGIKTLASLLTGGVIALWLWVLGVDYALLWGLLAFLLNYVPTIGSIIASLPAVLLALIQPGGGVDVALLAALGYLAVNIGVGNGLEPRFMGRGLGLSTLVVFLSLVIWGWVLGPVGMLLSVPLTMTAKIALDSREETRWLAILLGPESAVREPVE